MEEVERSIAAERALRRAACVSASCRRSSSILRRLKPIVAYIMPRPNWSRPLPRALTIPTIMDLVTLADVQTLLGHLPKATQAKSTWHHVEAALKQAATGGDTTELWAALQMVLMLEGVEYRLK